MSKGHGCKCKEVECEECPEWIFTLADLIMCMMGLFVILWVLKPGPKSKTDTLDGDWIKVVAAIRDAFGYMPDPKSTDPVDVHMLLKKLESLDAMKGPGDGGKTKLEESVLPCGIAAGLEPVLVLINDQKFTKTANCWGVDNNFKGTNTNRIVVLRKP